MWLITYIQIVKFALKLYKTLEKVITYKQENGKLLFTTRIKLEMIILWVN